MATQKSEDPTKILLKKLIFKQEGTPLAHIFARGQKESLMLAKRLKEIAEKYKGKLNFATIDATEYGFFASALGLIPDKFPAFVIEDLITGETTPFDQSTEITWQKIEMFVEKYFRDKERTKVREQVCWTLRLVRGLKF
jgi:protein disulfide-isomerase A1